MSPDNRLLAYAEDSVGRRQYTLRFKDLATGATLPDGIPNVEAALRLGRRQPHASFYVEKDPETLLGYRVRKHVARHGPEGRSARLRAARQSFYTSVGNDQGRPATSSSTREHGLERSALRRGRRPALRFTSLSPRERDHEYQAEHLDGRWIIRTNWQATNFRLMEAPVGEEADREPWRDVLPHRDDAFVHGFDVFDALPRDQRALGRAAQDPHPPLGRRRATSSSPPTKPPTRPARRQRRDRHRPRPLHLHLADHAGTTYDYDVRTGERTLLKREPVLGDFDSGQLRHRVPLGAGARRPAVPVSLVYRKGCARDGTAPLLQYGYGSYGCSHGPDVLGHAAVAARPRLRLRDRARARRPGARPALVRRRPPAQQAEHLHRLHRRDALPGGAALCRPDARVRDRRQRRRPADGRDRQHGAAGLPRHRRARALRRRRHDDARREHPADDQRIRRVGQPEEKEYYDYMLSYSPYDNVAAGLPGDAGHHRPVGQPGAVLRARQVGGAAARAQDRLEPAAVAHDMEAGHGGKSGRFQRYREIAEEYAFLLDQAGIAK